MTPNIRTALIAAAAFLAIAVGGSAAVLQVLAWTSRLGLGEFATFVALAVTFGGVCYLVAEGCRKLGIR